MTANQLDTYPVLSLDALGDNRFRAGHADRQEDRDVVFSGQIIAQMIMAADRSVESRMDVKSAHVIFARAGTYSQPIDYEVDTMQAGRTWASHTITARQGDRLLSRGLILMSVDEPDLISHQVNPPKVSSVADSEAAEISVPPGTETRTATGPTGTDPAVPSRAFWFRVPGLGDSVAAQQAALAWTTPGEIIGLAMSAHPDEVTISDSHHTLSTGVIAHTIHFHTRFLASEWSLVELEASFAGRGRVHGRGEVFGADGRLIATFSQDAMVKEAGRGRCAPDASNHWLYPIELALELQLS